MFEFNFEIMRKIILVLGLLIYFGLFPKCSFSQTNKKVDSLEKVLTTHIPDTLRLQILIRLYQHYSQTDTVQARKKLEACNEIINLKGEQIPPHFFVSLAYIFENKGDYVSALEYNQKAASLAEKRKDTKYYYNCKARISYILSLSGNHEEAVRLLLNLIQDVEKKQVKKTLHGLYMYLAFVYKFSGNNDKAKIYFEKSMNECEKNNDCQYFDSVLHELGNLYSVEGKPDQALKFHLKSIVVKEKKQDYHNLIYSYHDISIDYVQLDSTEKALKYLTLSEQLAEKFGDVWMIANIYRSKSEIYLGQKDFVNSERYLAKLQPLAESLGLKPSLAEYHNLAYQINKEQKRFSAALENYEIYNLYADSLYNEDITKNIDELDKKYETAKKDKEIVQNQERIKRQQILIISGIIGLVLFTFFIIIIFRLYRKTKASNIELAKKNQEILLQKEEISAQAEQLESANIEITQHKNKIEESHNKITASINYAQKIQNAVLPDTVNIDKILPEHFILFMPRDIVSGDFYFVKQYKNQVIVAVADCTGHGVPGAFLGMLGIAVLNEIVHRLDITSAAKVLDELRRQMKNSLQQTGQSGEQQDGMDISFTAIDTEKMILNFAGANNSLVLFRNDKLMETPGDHMPVGVFRNEHPFTDHYIDVTPDDMIYLYSDGFRSQFGGKSKLPLKSKPFKDFLMQIHRENIDIQQQKMTEFYHNWKENEVQIDDILVVGFKPKFNTHEAK